VPPTFTATTTPTRTPTRTATVTPGGPTFTPTPTRTPGPAGATSLHTLAPCRAIDTRGANGPALAGGSTRNFLLEGVCGIPTTAKAVSLNVTVTSATGAGDLRIFAGGTPQPLVSTINYRAGQTRANNAVAALGASGDLLVRCDQAGGTTVHMIIDVNGYFE